MTTANATQYETKRTTGPSLASLIPFDQITEPGAYICNWNGHLLRIPYEALSKSGTPAWNVVGAEPLFVTKVSNDPFVTLSQARMLACNFDINVNF
jgi:hypothetical protein